ncbi:hypothetical protein PTKIN_Ptkin12aG0050000 [Pterospermum kingtungense]
MREHLCWVSFFLVLDIPPPDADGQAPRIARQDLINNGLCKPGFQNSSPDYRPFELVNTSDYANVTLLYDCPNSLQTYLRHFKCGGNGDGYNDFWVVREDTYSEPCTVTVTIPINLGFPPAEIPSNHTSLLRELKKDFM